MGHVADVSSAADAKATADRAVEAFGTLHFAVNNAGIVGPATSMGELEPADWRRVIDVNLSGVAYGLRYQIPARLSCWVL